MIRKSPKAACITAAALVMLFFGGCGYHLVGERSSKESAPPLLVGPLIENQTRQTGVDLILTEAIAHRFILEGKPLDKPSGENQAHLRCIIRSLDMKAISFRRNLTAREYRITMTLDAAVEKGGGGAASWKARGITATRTYRVQTTIEATEREKKAAIEALSFDVAQIIADGVLRGF